MLEPAQVSLEAQRTTRPSMPSFIAPCAAERWELHSPLATLKLHSLRRALACPAPSEEMLEWLGEHLWVFFWGCCWPPEGCLDIYLSSTFRPLLSKCLPACLVPSLWVLLRNQFRAGSCVSHKHRKGSDTLETVARAFRSSHLISPGTRCARTAPAAHKCPTPQPGGSLGDVAAQFFFTLFIRF